MRFHPFVEKAIRAVIVTPDMHRIHHSIHVEETNSNFAFNLSVWDRVCGTYRKDPKDGHKNMTIGIESFREDKFLKLPLLLVIPFLRDSKKD